MKDPISHRSRGFGFITYENIESFEDALAIEDHVLDSRRVITYFCVAVTTFTMFKNAIII